MFTHFRSEIVLDRQEGELITQTFTDRKAIYTRGANADERKKPDDGSDGHGGDEVKKSGKRGKCDKEGKMMSAEFDFFLGWVWWGGDGVGWGESR